MTIPDAAVSDWIVVSQERITQFADATDDHQWIHVDPVRAESESPWSGTVAHGFLTLSLISALFRSAARIEGVKRVVNYGLNSVRFVTPVIAGSRIRGRFVAASVEEKHDATKVVWKVTVEREDGKPCCVAE